MRWGGVTRPTRWAPGVTSSATQRTVRFRVPGRVPAYWLLQNRTVRVWLRAK